MASSFSHLAAAAAGNPAVGETSQNPDDQIRAALAGRADLTETIRRLMASGVGVQAISNIFTNLGQQQSSAIGAYLRAAGIMGTGQAVKDYAGTLDHREAAEFRARSGRGMAGASSGPARREPQDHATTAADHAFAEAYGALSSEHKGELLSHMLFEPGHGHFWDHMAANGHISADTAEHAKGMAARLPADTHKQKQSLDAAIDSAAGSPAARAKAEEFKSSAEAKKLAEMTAKAQQLKELAERSRINGDKAAKDLEEQAERARMAADSYRIEQARLNPAIADGLQKYADQAGISVESSKAASTQDQEVHSLESAGLSAAQEAVKAQDKAAIVKLVLHDKTGAVAETSARAMISGSAESKVEAGKVLAANAASLGVVGEKEVVKAEQAVRSEAKKDAGLSAKLSGGLDAEDAIDGFGAAPPIASKLAQMRSPKEEAAPAPAKTASMSA